LLLDGIEAARIMRNSPDVLVDTMPILGLTADVKHPR
jgi:hypothetical protein